MNWPGEKLVEKLLEIVEKSGTGLLRPWQLRRVGKAESDVASHRMLLIAAAERKIDSLRIAPGLESKKVESTSNGPLLYIEPTLDQDLIIKNIENSRTADFLRKEVNVEKAISHAENTLKNIDAEISDKSVDMDWFFRWRDYAGEVSSEELQQIWGNVLAGEIKDPGSFSYRTLDFLRGIARDEAKLIERLASIVIEGNRVIHGKSFVPSKEIRSIMLPLENHELMILEEIGILTGVPILGFTDEKPPLPSGGGDFLHLLTCGGRGILAKTDDAKKFTKLGFYQVTKLGVNVLKLVQMVPDEDHLLSIGQRLVAEGFVVQIGDVLDNWNGARGFRKSIDVTLPGENAAQS